MNETIRSAHEIRRAYIDFFVKRGHTEVPGAPLVPKGDPTLLFTSAGMVQFKEYYLQIDNLPYARAASVQKCLRAGDLDSVGRTLRHNTFFEMLGNFSFGDYFKEEAITWGWEFVVDLLGLDTNKLYVSIYEDDDEAFTIWNERIGVPAERIYRLGRDDNFWGPVGKTGICGPCSEIYYDTGAGRSCGSKDCAPGCDCDRFLEFWNLVFPQFYLEENGTYRPLEKPGIDTGLGLERLAMIMQGVEDNFHTDLFAPILDALIGLLPSGFNMSKEDRMGINMVADHVRALTFTVSEGIYPSNEGRGYLLRRLLRRALTRYYTFGVGEPFLHGLVDTVVDIMREDYPELEQRRRDTAMIIQAEEKNFFRTLEDGTGRFSAIVDEVREKGGTGIDGERAFLLYDTFGFPLELTRELASKEGLGIDEAGFEKAMEQQRRRAQEKSGFTGEEQELVSMTGVTEGDSSEFTGYETVGGEALVRSFRVVDKAKIPGVSWHRGEGKAVEFILDRTPFYAASGGQVADTGWIKLGAGLYHVRDVFKRGGEIVHLAEPAEPGTAPDGIGERNVCVQVQVNDQHRLAIARNHTATHLLQAALREVVGGHVTQAGSLVDAEHLRFDFNHFQALTESAKRMIEERVNVWIRDAVPVGIEWLEYREAIERGATALFEEKYGAKVRTVTIGNVSMELCGGTHVSNTGQIGAFLITAESSVAAGVRRIEALTGAGAVEHIHSLTGRVARLSELLRVSPSDVIGRVGSLIDEIDGLKREIRRLEKGEIGGELDRIIREAQDVDGILVASGRVSAGDLSALRNQADVFRNRVGSGVAVFSAPFKDRMQYIVTVTDDLIEEGRLAADGLVRRLSEVAGGGGGGKRHLAQLGTRDTESEGKVFEALPGIVRELVSG